MSRIPAWARPVPLLLVVLGLRRLVTRPDRTIAGHIISGGYVERDGHDPGQSWGTRTRRRPAPDRSVDLRGSAADEPAVVPGDRSVGSSVADVMTTATTALTPGNTPPAQISTQGEFTSPRACRGTFGSVGTAQATRIEADFTGRTVSRRRSLGTLC